MEAPQLDGLANDFFDAIARGDLERVAEIYDPAVEVWHNVTGRTQTRDENLALLDDFTSSVSDLRYEVHGRDFFPGGFVQRHTLHGRSRSGETIAAPVCIVIHAADGRIRRLFEYLDPRAVAPAFAT
ncbi:MAG: nuclear transport factor 2 family protein [Myxococcota bacterium]